MPRGYIRESDTRGRYTRERDTKGQRYQGDISGRVIPEAEIPGREIPRGRDTREKDTKGIYQGE